MKRAQKEDLKKLANAFYKNLEITSWEFGGIGLNPKRPFGSSDVHKSMLEIIGWKPEGRDEEGKCYTDHQIDYIRNLYFRKLIPFLQKNWRTHIGDPDKIAETQTKIINTERRKNGDRAISYIQDLFESLDKPIHEFTELIRQLKYHWESNKNGKNCS